MPGKGLQIACSDTRKLCDLALECSEFYQTCSCTWSTVASTSRVSVVVMVCSAILCSLPTLTGPIYGSSTAAHIRMGCNNKFLLRHVREDCIMHYCGCWQRTSTVRVGLRRVCHVLSQYCATPPAAVSACWVSRCGGAATACGTEKAPVLGHHLEPQPYTCDADALALCQMQVQAPELKAAAARPMPQAHLRSVSTASCTHTSTADVPPLPNIVKYRYWCPLSHDWAERAPGLPIARSCEARCSVLRI